MWLTPLPRRMPSQLVHMAANKFALRRWKWLTRITSILSTAFRVSQTPKEGKKASKAMPAENVANDLADDLECSIADQQRRLPDMRAVGNS